MRQTGTGRIDGGDYYNAIHFDEHVELNTAPQFIDNTIAYSGGHGNAINSQKADGAQIIGNHAEHFNHNGFDTKQSASVVVRGNVAHDASEANGIYQEYCANGMIENNLGLQPERARCRDAVPAFKSTRVTSGATIMRNSISNVLTGIYLITPATVRYNSVSNAGHAALEANAGGDSEFLRSQRVTDDLPVLEGNEQSRENLTNPARSRHFANSNSISKFTRDRRFFGSSHG